MAHLPLPPPRPVLHPLRAPVPARCLVKKLPSGRRRATIDHEPLNGLTPEMLLWWFSNIGGEMDYGGVSIDRYLVWHPLDHIRWALAKPGPTGRAEEGANFRIVEAFGANADYYIDSTETVEKLDVTGIRLVRRVAGVPVLQLEHIWSRCDGHVHYVSVMDIGAPVWFLRPVNRLLSTRLMPEPKLRAWIKHNVEEVGVLEHILPSLYESSVGGVTAGAG